MRSYSHKTKMYYNLKFKHNFTLAIFETLRFIHEYLKKWTFLFSKEDTSNMFIHLKKCP
uniref:Uncharacterized protein n=1 Tax=Lepeophtheirus salmonis TaxID=72036 RepID=A0A0K2VDP5_LEPSM